MTQGKVSFESKEREIKTLKTSFEKVKKSIESLKTELAT